MYNLHNSLTMGGQLALTDALMYLNEVQQDHLMEKIDELVDNAHGDAVTHAIVEEAMIILFPMNEGE